MENEYEHRLYMDPPGCIAEPCFVDNGSFTISLSSIVFLFESDGPLGCVALQRSHHRHASASTDMYMDANNKQQ